ncbi:MAG: hypothetical protein J0H25_17275 [Rhizobiales bacterium]|nr:hypothetical protein [Hyphomicrobiales bacterium]
MLCSIDDIYLKQPVKFGNGVLKFSFLLFAGGFSFLALKRLTGIRVGAPLFSILEHVSEERPNEPDEMF